VATEPTESEIKVSITDEEAERIRRHLGPPAHKLRQINHYFETAEDHLAKARLSLRVREESDLAGGGTNILLTVKSAGLRAGALMVRPEIESQLDASAWDGLQAGRLHFAQLDLEPIKKLKDAIEELETLELSLLGRVENMREVYEFRADEMPLEVLIDRTTYPDGGSDIELESELSQARAGQGARVLRALFDELGVDWRPADVGKYTRFRRRIGRDPDEVRAQA
jgi:uncharacterized protein YjbK